MYFYISFSRADSFEEKYAHKNKSNEFFLKNSRADSFKEYMLTKIKVMNFLKNSRADSFKEYMYFESGQLFAKKLKKIPRIQGRI